MRLGMYLLLTIFLAAGCSDDDNGPVTDAGTDVQAVTDGQPLADLGEPSAAFKDEVGYQGYQGQVSLETVVNAAVIKVELLVNGQVAATADSAPFSIEWDTTKTADGVAKLSLKAHGQDTSVMTEEVPVVVYNNGEKPNWKDGNGGTMTILPPPADNHLKYHWDMPASITKIVAILFWDNAAFKMKLDVGVGWCPHSGTSAANVESETSPVLLEYEAEAGTLQVTEWFAHAGTTNDEDIVDQSTDLSFEVFLLK